MYIESNISVKGATPEQIKEITSESIFFFDSYKNDEDNYYLHHGEENPWVTIDIHYDDETTPEIISSIRELVEYCKRHNLVCDGWITVDPEQDDEEYVEIDITNNVISIE